MMTEPMTLEVSEQFFAHGLTSDDPPLAVIPAARRVYEEGIRARTLTADYYTIEELTEALNQTIDPSDPEQEKLRVKTGSMMLLFRRYMADKELAVYIGEVDIRPGMGRLGGQRELTREQAHDFLTLRAHFTHANKGVGRGKNPDEMKAMRGAQSQHKTRSK